MGELAGVRDGVSALGGCSHGPRPSLEQLPPRVGAEGMETRSDHHWQQEPGLGLPRGQLVLGLWAVIVMDCVSGLAGALG